MCAVVTGLYYVLAHTCLLVFEEDNLVLCLPPPLWLLLFVCLAQSNPESAVGLLTTAGKKRARVILTPTTEIRKLYQALHGNPALLFFCS